MRLFIFWLDALFMRSANGYATGRFHPSLLN